VGERPEGTVCRWKICFTAQMQLSRNSCSNLSSSAKKVPNEGNKIAYETVRMVVMRDLSCLLGLNFDMMKKKMLE